MKIIKAIHIQTYIEKEPRRAQELFPELIRKLIVASLNKNGNPHFPSGASIYVHGWDGIVKNNLNNNSFVPIGDSYWEIGTNKNAFSKIEKDYNKRITDSTITLKKNYSYISVVGQNMDSKKKDELEKKLSKHPIFKTVIIYDANDIENWIESHFDIAIWFMKQIGEKINQYNIKTLSEAWNEIHESTNPPFNEELYLIDNDATAQKIVEDISKNGNTFFTIKSCFYGIDYAYYFIVAAINKYGNSIIKNNTLTINDLEELLIIDSFCEEKIIIANINNFPIRNIKKPNNTYIMFDKLSDTIYSINRITKEDFGKKIIENNIINENKSSTIRNCDYNIVTLKRLLSVNQFDRIPKWAKQTIKNKLIPLTIIGKINLNNNCDCKLIEDILGEQYDNYFESLNYLYESGDVPFFKDDSIYKINSRLECYTYIQIDFFSNKVKKIEKFIRSIFLDKNKLINKSIMFENNKDEINESTIINILDGFVILAMKTINNQRHYDDYIYNLLNDVMIEHELAIKLVDYLFKLVEISPEGVILFFERNFYPKNMNYKNIFIDEKIRDSFCNALEYAARYNSFF